MRKYVLVGAGSMSFTRGLVTDVIRLGREVELGLVDIDPEALRYAEALTVKMVEAMRAPVRVRASVDRRDLLPGADAVVCTVGVGGRRAWERDVFIPRQHGIFQPVGDTAMPGGLSRALRMIPAMVAIARDVLDLCPNALFFNYGNPMTAVCRAIRKATGAKVVGLCHGVLGLAQYLANFIRVPFPEVSYAAVGINHLTWMTEFRHKGRDAWPLVREELARRLGEGIDVAQLGAKFAEMGQRPELAQRLGQPFSWELFSLYGAIPSALDRHVSEFFPQFFASGAYYGKTLGVDVYSVEATIADGDRRYEQTRELALSRDPLPQDFFARFSGEHEQVTDIIDSIEADAGRVYSANLPNQGQVRNLPPDAILESPALADGSGMHALAMADLSPGIAATLVSRLDVVEIIVEAALRGDRELFVQALVADGFVRSIAMARQLADELLAAQAEFLPQFKKA